MVESTLSVPWITGPGWEGSPEELKLTSSCRASALPASELARRASRG